MQSKLTFSRKPVAHLDRRRELAQRIVDRHSEQEQQAKWQAYVIGLGNMARYYLKTRGSLPEQMAELLEPGALAKMVAAESVRR